MGAGGASLAAYLAIAVLSFQFTPESVLVDRPILSVLASLALAFTAYLVALRAVVRTEPRSLSMRIVFLPAIIFRLVMIVSLPIQEVDIYRYLWDGAAGAAGVNPYHYSPSQVIEWHDADDEARSDLPDDFRHLLSEIEASASLQDVLQRVHFPELPTVYPPVSQWVFAAVDWVTPDQASTYVRVAVMKSVLVGFDLATAAMMLVLLRAAGRHEGWVVAYAWCPLVIKEIAGNGHLDSIAVFLTMSATATAYGTLFTRPAGGGARGGFSKLVLSAVLLAAGVGAKLYSIVLVPLLLAASAGRFGIRAALGIAGVFLTATTLLLAPMMPAQLVDSPAPQGPGPSDSDGTAHQPHRQNPARGLEAFLRYWEMNDLLFMVLVENLTPRTEPPQPPDPWFAVTPHSWRTAFVTPVTRLAGVSPQNAAFLLTRLVTTTIFLGIAVWLAWRPWSRNAGPDWLGASFLTVAWFWLLSPTQNPWYWIWALPLVPFARSRLWLLPSGLALIYYLRFWLSYHWPQTNVPGLGYSGSYAFDYVVTWVEFGPWLLALAAEALLRSAGRAVPDLTDWSMKGGT